MLELKVGGGEKDVRLVKRGLGSSQETLRCRETVLPANLWKTSATEDEKNGKRTGSRQRIKNLCINEERW